MTASFDSSLRYVLPEGSPLLANLAALWSADQQLAAALEALPDDAAYPVEIAKSGDATLALTTPNGRRIYLHSRHQPAEEAKRFIASSAVAGKPAVFLMGFGLGYHFESLWEAVGEETFVCVFEPDLRMLWTAFHCRDFSRMISSRRLVFFCRPDKSNIFSRLSSQSAVLSLGPEKIVHAPSVQLAPEFFAQMDIWLDELASFIRTGMNTLVLNSGKTAENVAANIGWYAASPSAGRLNGRFRGSPAVIVSAGPSLRKNKHLLKGLEDRAVVIAVQTTLQPLLEMGVCPHFVTSLDYHEICGRFFENLPAGLTTELVAEPKAADVVFRLNPGPLTVLGNNFAQSLLRELDLQRPVLPAGATVAHLAFYLAEYLGCDPIIFVGQDLAFSDGLCYSPGTSYEDVWRPELSRFCTVEMKQWEQIVRERPILRKVPDAQGNLLYTEERLFMYLQQFERDFGQSKSRIIDATEGGALKRGATPMTLAQAIETHCRNSLPPSTGDYPGMDWAILPRCITCLENRRRESGEIARISRLTLPLLEEIAAHLDDQPRVNRAIGRIDLLRKQMDEFGKTYDLVTQLTQETEMKRFEADRKVASSKAAGADRQRLQIERDIENVKAMIEAAAEFAKLMDVTIARVEAQIAEHGAKQYERPAALAA
jgi:hypothetical protein